MTAPYDCLCPNFQVLLQRNEELASIFRGIQHMIRYPYGFLQSLFVSTYDCQMKYALDSEPLRQSLQAHSLLGSDTSPSHSQSSQYVSSYIEDIIIQFSSKMYSYHSQDLQQSTLWNTDSQRVARMPVYDCQGAINVHFHQGSNRIMVVYKHSPIHRTLASRKLHKAEQEWYARQQRLATGNPTVADTLVAAHAHINALQTPKHSDTVLATADTTDRSSLKYADSPGEANDTGTPTSDPLPRGKGTLHAAIRPFALQALSAAPTSTGIVTKPWADLPTPVTFADVASSNRLPRVTDSHVTVNGTPKQPGIFETRPAGTESKSTYKPQQRYIAIPRSTSQYSQDGDSEKKPIHSRTKDGCMACRSRRVKVGPIGMSTYVLAN